jgi:hypothetical protein
VTCNIALRIVNNHKIYMSKQDQIMSDAKICHTLFNFILVESKIFF